MASFRRLFRLSGREPALCGFGWSASFTIDSVPAPDGVSQSAQLREVTPDYFPTVRMPIVKGRGFTAEDRGGGRQGLVVSAAAARRFWPNGNVLGRHVRMGARPGSGDERPEGEIVGVVGDVHDRALDADPRPIVYASLEQVPVGSFTLLSPGQTRAPAAAGDSLAQALFRRPQPPALSIALVRGKGDAERWQIGEADLAQHRHAGRDTRFRIGSDAKLFTAAIAARLAAGGTLDLDAPIARYLPKLPAAYRNLTARQLAGHLAGVRHYGPGEFISRVGYPSVSASLAIFLKDTLLTPPGARYFYSSYGFNLLAAVLEAAAGQSFSQLLRREVTEPLHLRQIALEPSGELTARQAQPYSRDSVGTYRPSPAADLSDRWPSGGMVATAEDLARFGLGVFGSGYLPESIRPLFLTSQRTDSGRVTQVRLGWRAGLTRQTIRASWRVVPGRAHLPAGLSQGRGCGRAAR